MRMVKHREFKGFAQADTEAAGLEPEFLTSSPVCFPEGHVGHFHFILHGLTLRPVVAPISLSDSGVSI